MSGAIYKQYYTEGTYVKKDQPLYQIDPRPFELALQQAQGNLVRDKASMDNYKIIYSVDIELKLIKVADVFDTRQNPIKIKRNK